MFKIVISCNETGETRTYENCRLLTENLPSIQLETTRLGGNWYKSQYPNYQKRENKNYQFR